MADPDVEGPVEGGIRGYPWNHSLFELGGRAYEYTENEFFFGGTASNLGNGAAAPYKSRMLVRRPSDPREFSGIVIVEWLNVTGQMDLETAWPVEAEYLMRHGAAYVGVSAQLAGVCCGPTTLKGWDPERYAPLSHPSDTFQHDIFSQAIRALRAPTGVDPLQGLRPEDVVVTGASQSAIFLTDFINEGYARGQVDAFVITRGGGPFEDFSTPIFQLNEEGLEEHPPDSDKYVLWEEAGTAHAPKVWWNYVFAQQKRDLLGPEATDAIDAACSVNQGTVDYSTRALSRWVVRYLRRGKLPPSAPRIERDDSGNVVRDAIGLAKSGLRHPFVEVPISYNAAAGCPLYGTWRPWSSEKITSMYPTHAEYVKRIRVWSREEVRRGWLLRGDRKDVLAKAKVFTQPWSPDGCEECVAPLGL